MRKYLITALVVLSVVSIFIGVQTVTPMALLSGDAHAIELVLTSRIPRLISILVVGAGLAIAGVVMQQITGNKFVSPSTAGTVEFARLGILVAIFIFPTASMMFKMGLAFIFALIGTVIFMTILDKITVKDTIFIPLVGIMFGGIVGAVSTFFAYQYNLVQNIDSWIQGSFSLIIKGRYELLYIGIPMFIIAYLFANRFTIAGLGEDFSENLGLSYQSTVNIGMTICAFITAVVVVTVGSIPFIGIIIPNIVSLTRGDNIKDTLPDTAMMGAAFVLFCDIVARLIIHPYEVPISVIAGVIGSIVFIYLILRKEPESAGA